MHCPGASTTPQPVTNVDNVETQAVDVMAVDTFPDSMEPSMSPKLSSDELRSQFHGTGAEHPAVDLTMGDDPNPTPPVTAQPEAWSSNMVGLNPWFWSLSK